MKTEEILRKYCDIKRMKSISPLTSNMYPAINEFGRALKEGRVAGDYKKRLKIVSNNPLENFIFVFPEDEENEEEEPESNYSLTGY
jgi:hypothetical protein